MQQALHEGRRTDARRRDLIIALRTLRDVGETLQRGDSGGKFVPSSRLMLMPAAWHAGCPPTCIGRGGNDPRACRSTYVRLSLSLSAMRTKTPDLYWHLSQRCLQSEWETHDLVRKVPFSRGLYWRAALNRRWDDANRHFHVSWAWGDRLTVYPDAGASAQILKETRRADQVVKKGPNGERGELYRAKVELWDRRVDHGIVEDALKVLMRLVPRIVFPRDVDLHEYGSYVF